MYEALDLIPCISKNEFIIKTAQKKSQGPNDFIRGFHQMFKQELVSILYNLFQKIKENSSEIIL
jgi:hypothetical protein